MGAQARASWVDGPNAALRGAVVSVLVDRGEEYISPYRLGTLLQRYLGTAWQIETKALYRLLPALEKEGLVESVLRPKRRGEPKPEYRATEEAEGVREEWMRAPVGAVPRRAELQALIAVSKERDIPHLERALDEYERDCFHLIGKTELADLRMISWRAVAINMTRTGDHLHLKAELEWIQKCRAFIEDWQRGPRTPEVERQGR